MTLHVLIFVASLIPAIFIHELGHFLIARYCGVSVLNVSVGFGPELFGFTDRYGTSWKFRAFPVGGSCSLSDDNFQGHRCDKDTPDPMFRNSLRKRAAIYAAGPSFNFILALILYAVTLMLCKSCGSLVSGIGSPELVFIKLSCSFSICNGLFNLLPLLPLDGGFLSLIAVEAIRGRPTSQSAEKSFFVFSLTALSGTTLAVVVGLWALVFLIR
jgi:membrane-associated protease RseP (regulator of RpoE activity)